MVEKEIGNIIKNDRKLWNSPKKSHLHETNTRKLNLLGKSAKAGRFSVLGEYQMADALNLVKKFQLEQEQRATKKSITRVARNEITNEMHRSMALSITKRIEAPDSYYIAKTINYAVKLDELSKRVAYCTDKRINNSVRIKIDVQVNDKKVPISCTINIYE